MKLREWRKLIWSVKQPSHSCMLLAPSYTLLQFSNGLTGTVPPEIVLFNQTLRVLDLGDTFSFTTPEFNTVLGELTALVDLRYDKANFIDFQGIPLEIGNLKKLVWYDASRTLYAGILNGAAFPSDMTSLGESPI